MCGLCCRKVSVCLFVTRRYSVKTAKHILKLFSPSGSQPSFSYQMVWQYCDCDPPPNRGVECKGVWKKSRFRPISRFISEMTQDGAIITMKCEYETVSTLLNDTSFNRLEWPLTQILRSRHYWRLVSQNTRCRHYYNKILRRTSATPTQVSFQMILKTFNDTKHRAVSLLQLSFLSDIVRQCSVVCSAYKLLWSTDPLWMIH